jgi:hypothetical protein
MKTIQGVPCYITTPTLTSHSNASPATQTVEKPAIAENLVVEDVEHHQEAENGNEGRQGSVSGVGGGGKYIVIFTDVFGLGIVNPKLVADQ